MHIQLALDLIHSRTRTSCLMKDYPSAITFKCFFSHIIDSLAMQPSPYKTATLPYPTQRQFPLRSTAAVSFDGIKYLKMIASIISFLIFMASVIGIIFYALSRD